MDCTNSGVKDSATVTATPVSYKTAGSERRRRVRAGQRFSAAPETEQDHGHCKTKNKASRNGLQRHRTADAHGGAAQRAAALAAGEEHVPGDAAWPEEDFITI